ncbi:MAG: AzlD domain-containing protein [Firmicutes bacterium]|jgi:branched-subunit amino acid transport protein|nr:AzlD domain-containing protein [Bacillota bacterium]
MQRTVIAIILMAVVTYISRALPMISVKKRSKSRFLLSFLYYVPFAALGAMTFPAILYSTGDMTSALIGMAVALVLAFLEKSLLEVAIGAIVTVYLIQLFVH